MKWQAIVMIALWAASLGLAISKYEEIEVRKNKLLQTVIAIAIEAFLLASGGFFS